MAGHEIGNLSYKMRVSKILLFYFMFLLLTTLIWLLSFADVGVGSNDRPRLDYGELEILMVLSLMCLAILPSGCVYTSGLEINKKIKVLWSTTFVLIVIVSLSGVVIYQLFAGQGTGLAALFIIFMIVVAAVSMLIITFVLTKTARLDPERQLNRFVKIVIGLITLNLLSCMNIYLL